MATLINWSPRRQRMNVVLVALATLGALLAVGGGPAQARHDAGTVALSNGAVPLVFASLRHGNSELYAVQPDGSGPTRLTNHKAIDAFPSLSPDGTRIAFVSTRDGNSELYAMKLDGTGLVRLTNHAAIDTEPDWSPDGSRIAFSSSRTGNGDIYTASSSDGSGLARLTSDKAPDVSPAWSPDGSQLLFASLRSGNGDLYAVNTGGGAQTRLTTNGAPDLFPAWSPGGDKLAFASLRSGNSDIYTMKPDGTQQLRLTQSAAIESEPAWSPDGGRLALSSNAPGKLNFDLYLLNADGTGATPLAPHSALDASPDWAHSAAGPPPAFNGIATPVLSTTQVAHGTIGRLGGTLESGGVRLDIPAGALSEEVEITLRAMTGLIGSPLDGSFIGGAKLEPEGLRFLKPAVLSMPVPAGVQPQDVLGFGSAGDGSDLHLVPREVQAGRVEIEVWHFSTGGASSGGSGAAAVMQGYQPSAGESAAQQRIAAAQPACEAELAQDIFDGPACTHLKQEQIRALRGWYVDTVKPGLEQAVGAPSFDVEKAMAEWLQWAATVAATLSDLTGVCGPLTSECNQARTLATSAVADLAQRRLNNCTGTSLVAQLRDVSRVADFVSAGALDLTGTGLPAVAALPRECAHLKIEVLEFPAVAALLYSNTLRGVVKVDVYNGADRTDVPFTLTVDGAPVGAAGDGSFQTSITPTAPPVNVLLEAMATNATLQNTSFGTSTILARPARERVELEALGPVAITPGGTVTLRARVAGDAMAGANLTYSSQGIGSLGATSGTTNDQGEAPLFVYTAPSDPEGGSATIAAAFGDATDSLTITVEAEPETHVRFRSPPTSPLPTPGGPTELCVDIFDEENTLLGGVTVTWGLSGPGSLGAATSVSNGSGVACVAYQHPSFFDLEQASATVTARATHQGAEGSASVSLTLRPGLVVEITPLGGNAFAGDVKDFDARVVDRGTGQVLSTDIAWAACCAGSITQAGTLTIPEDTPSTTIAVTAVAVDFPSVSATVSVTVIPKGSVRLIRTEVSGNASAGIYGTCHPTGNCDELGESSFVIWPVNTLSGGSGNTANAGGQCDPGLGGGSASASGSSTHAFSVSVLDEKVTQISASGSGTSFGTRDSFPGCFRGADASAVADIWFEVIGGNVPFRLSLSVSSTDPTNCGSGQARAGGSAILRDQVGNIMQGFQLFCGSDSRSLAIDAPVGLSPGSYSVHVGAGSSANAGGGDGVVTSGSASLDLTFDP